MKRRDINQWVFRKKSVGFLINIVKQNDSIDMNTLKAAIKMCWYGNVDTQREKQPPKDT